MMDRIGKLRAGAKVKLNIGCGSSHLEDAINIDLHGSPDICADARSLPISAASVDWIECHHMLEHFTLEEGKKVVSEWARTLKADGLLFVTVPDFCAIHRFMEATKGMIEPWASLVMFIYGQDGPGMRHLSAYSPDYLAYRLKEAGFKQCEVMNWPYRPTPSFGVLACR